MLSNYLIFCCLLLLLPSAFLSIRTFSNESAFASGGQSTGASASVLSMSFQGWSPLELTVLTSVLSKESQESSPSPQFKSINSLVPLSDLYRDYWKNHSFDCQFSSVTQSCLTLSNPMDCSTPGFPVRHQLPEPIQTHVHCIGGAIQPSHPLLSSLPFAFNLSHIRVFSNESALHIRWTEYWAAICGLVWLGNQKNHII